MKNREMKQDPAFVQVPELPELEPEKGKKGEKSKRIARLLELHKERIIPSILPTPTPIPKDNVVKIAQKCLHAMLEIQQSETGNNVYSDWFDIEIIEVKEKKDPETGSAFAYCIYFCVSMDYFFEGNHKEYYRVSMTDWGGVIQIAKNNKDKRGSV